MTNTNITYLWGKHDGEASATHRNPIHNNWQRNKAGKAIHFDKQYLKGYNEGFKSIAGYLPKCLEPTFI